MGNTRDLPFFSITRACLEAGEGTAEEWAGSESPHLSGVRVQCAGSGGPSQPCAWGGDTCPVLLWVCACSQVTPFSPSGLISPASASLEAAGLGFAGTWDGPASAEGGPAWPSVSRGLALLPRVCSAVSAHCVGSCRQLRGLPCPVSPAFSGPWGTECGTGSQIAMTSPGGAEEAEGLERGWGWPGALAFPQNSDGKSRWRCGKWLFGASGLWGWLRTLPMSPSSDSPFSDPPQAPSSHLRSSVFSALTLPSVH